jgi:hypothetical protein
MQKGGFAAFIGIDCTLVPVDERLVFRGVKGVRGRHVKEVSMKELAAEGGFRRCHSGFK